MSADEAKVELRIFEGGSELAASAVRGTPAQRAADAGQTEPSWIIGDIAAPVDGLKIQESSDVVSEDTSKQDASLAGKQRNEEPHVLIEINEQEEAAEEPSRATSTLDQVTNPFGDQFSEEEVVLQDFISPSALLRDSYDPVTTAYSQQLAFQLSAAHPGLRMHPSSDIIETEDVDVDEFQPLSACLESDRFVANDIEAEDIEAEDIEDSEVIFESTELAGNDDPVMPEPSACVSAAETSSSEFAPADEFEESNEQPPDDPDWDHSMARAIEQRDDADSIEDVSDADRGMTEDVMTVIARIEKPECLEATTKRKRRFGQLFSGMRSKTMRDED